MISERDDKSILSTTSTFISGNFNKNDVFSSRKSNNNVNDVIEDTIDKDENYDYNKDDHNLPAIQHAIGLFTTVHTIQFSDKKRSMC